MRTTSGRTGGVSLEALVRVEKRVEAAIAAAYTLRMLGENSNNDIQKFGEEGRKANSPPRASLLY